MMATPSIMLASGLVRPWAAYRKPAKMMPRLRLSHSPRFIETTSGTNDSTIITRMKLRASVVR